MIYPVGNYLLHLPPEHNLPLIQKLDPLYDHGYLPLIQEILIAEPNKVVVDIGANVGDTACAIASMARNKIYCVEGSVKYLPYLRRNVKLLDGQAVITGKFIDVSLREELNLKFLERDGTGSFAYDQKESDPISNDKFIQMSDFLYTIPEPIGLFKTDTDGLDLQICEAFISCYDIEGTALWCEFNQPDEYTSEADQLSFLNSLKELGFSASIFSNRGIPLLFQEVIDPKAILDIMLFGRLSSYSSAQSIHYLDIFFLPLKQMNIFDNVAKGYRERFYL